MKLTFDLSREELGALIPVLKSGELDTQLDTVFIEACYSTPGKEFTLVCILKDLISPTFFSFTLGLEIGKHLKPLKTNNNDYHYRPSGPSRF
jgi:hypothetical protein